MVHRWRIFGDFLGPAFPASRVQHISDLHSKFALGPHHVSKLVDIQSATAEIRRGKKERRKKKQDKNIMFASATQGGHKITVTRALTQSFTSDLNGFTTKSSPCSPKTWRAEQQLV